MSSAKIESVKLEEVNREITDLVDVTKMNIYQKMSAITSELKRVAKNLDVGVGKSSYKAVGEADVLDAVKPLEAIYNVYSFPLSRVIEESGFIENEKIDYNTKQPLKTKQLYMRLQTVYRFVNIDNPNDFIDISTYGDGVDSQDKAPGKAMTYADKYALMKAYKISTGEDLDQDKSGTLLKIDKTTSKPKETKAISQQPITQEPTIMDLTILWGKQRKKMDELKINYRSQALARWFEESTGSASQDTTEDIVHMTKLTNAYKALIENKEKTNE